MRPGGLSHCPQIRQLRSSGDPASLSNRVTSSALTSGGLQTPQIYPVSLKTFRTPSGYKHSPHLRFCEEEFQGSPPILVFLLPEECCQPLILPPLWQLVWLPGVLSEPAAASLVSPARLPGRKPFPPQLILVVHCTVLLLRRRL